MIAFLLVFGVYICSVLYVIFRPLSPDARVCAAETFPKWRTEMLKGVAAVGIMLSHLATHSNGVEMGDISGILLYIIRMGKTLGFVGVDLFFLISGYANYLSVSKASSLSDRAAWLWKRIYQILLIYIICFVLDLIVLFVMGNGMEASEVVNTLIHLRMPLTSAWYIRIQLLAYVFLFAASFVKRQNWQIVVLCVLGVIASFTLYSMEYADYWWMSTLCFPAGAGVAMKRKEISDCLTRRKRTLLLVCTVLFVIAYLLAVAVDLFSVKTVANVLLALDILFLAELLIKKGGIWERIGAYSLPLYLAHISINAWIMRERVLSNGRVAAVVFLSFGVAFAAKQLSDRILRRAVKSR